jgi:hemoglobin
MHATDDQEAAIAQMVRLFYERGLADELLGPIFRDTIHDWDAHMAVVADFWSGAVHGTARYRGNAYAQHARLKFEPEVFDHWLVVFESAASDALAPQDAEKAIRVARHMAQSFRQGLFPFTGSVGRPSRTVPRG